MYVYTYTHIYIHISNWFGRTGWKNGTGQTTFSNAAEVWPAADIVQGIGWADRLSRLFSSDRLTAEVTIGSGPNHDDGDDDNDYDGDYDDDEDHDDDDDDDDEDNDVDDDGDDDDGDDECMVYSTCGCVCVMTFAYLHCVHTIDYAHT